MCKYLVALGIAALAAICAGFNVNRQEQISINGGKGWDGVYYERMCEYFKTGKSDKIASPFGKRVAVPYLASLIPTDSKSAFLAINVSAGILTVFVSALALGFVVRPIGVLACALPLIFHLFSPIRLSPFYPFSVDPLAMLMYALASLFLVLKRPWPVVLALVLSVLVRESGIYFALVIPAVLWLKGNLSRWHLISMAALAFIAYVGSTTLYIGESGASQFVVSLYYIWKKMLNPVELVKATAGVLQTVGPFLILYSVRPKHMQEESCMSINVESVACMLALLMACLGGSDTTRIFFIAFPLYALLLARQTDSRATSLLIATSALGLIANRFLLEIPQPSSVNPIRATDGFFALFPDYAEPAIAASTLVYWLLAWVLIKQIDWVKLDVQLRLCKEITK